MNIYDLPHDQAKQYLKQHDFPVFVYINPIEYHGPHLSLNTDSLQSIALGERLHKLLCQEHGDHPYMVAADIRLGVDPTPGVGTVATSFPDLKSIVLKISKSLLKMGARKVIFITHHGAPHHSLAIYAGVKFLRENGVKAISPFVKVINKMLDFDPVPYYPLAEKLGEPKSFIDDLQYDFHAGCFETSVCMYLAPESVSPIYATLKDAPIVRKWPLLHALSKVVQPIHAKTAHELDYAAFGVGWIKQRPFPGYSGKPAKSRPEIGEYFVNQHILPLYLEEANKCLWGEQLPVVPMMDWLSKLPV